MSSQPAFTSSFCSKALGSTTSVLPKRATCVRPAHATPMMSVARKSHYNITLLPGDGIGPEITKVAVDVLKSTAKKFNFEAKFTEALIGGCAIDATNNPFPEESLKQCKAADSILLAAIGGPKWDKLPREIRPETGLLAMRKGLGLFANLRPAKTVDQLLSASTLKEEIIKGVDIMVVRELTGDVYFGKPKGIDNDPVTGERRGYSNMIYYEHEVDRIARVAFDIARKRGKKVCSVDKANVLDVSQLWRDVVMKVHTEYPDVELSHMYVDNAAMQLIRWPKQFDVIVTGNMFGDILSDEASMLVGSLGMLPSASLGDGKGPGVFEPIHGSAPDIANQDKANPIATVLSVAMMLRYDLSQPEAADHIEKAVDRVLKLGYRTKDIMSEGMKEVGCKAMGEQLVKAVEH